MSCSHGTPWITTQMFSSILCEEVKFSLTVFLGPPFLTLLGEFVHHPLVHCFFGLFLTFGQLRGRYLFIRQSFHLKATFEKYLYLHQIISIGTIPPADLSDLFKQIPELPSKLSCLNFPNSTATPYVWTSALTFQEFLLAWLGSARSRNQKFVPHIPASKNAIQATSGVKAR